ncbi:hypothetical protein FISHEDRAFT_71444 [Fistulina hepatica ATCC 64428]|nr:hypothetical protein FISHEDRAFT_71444 [Fistulina hepatica ATCC 64428]
MPFVPALQPMFDTPMLVITTTVYTAPTVQASPSAHDSQSGLPIGAVVGGLCGGSLLAVMAVAGWILWGKAIDRRHKEEVTIVLTEINESSIPSRPRGRHPGLIAHSLPAPLAPSSGSQTV